MLCTPRLPRGPAGPGRDRDGAESRPAAAGGLAERTRGSGSRRRVPVGAEIRATRVEAASACVAGRDAPGWQIPAETPAPLAAPAPSRLVFGRGLCVLCVAECHGRGASPAARYFQSRTRRKAPYQDKSPRRRHPPAPASPTPGAVGGAGSADGCTYRAGGLAKRFNPSHPLCRRRQRVWCPAPQTARWPPALLTLPVGRGRSSVAVPAPVNLSLFSVCCLAGAALDGSSAPRPGTAKQGPTQNSPNTSRAGSKGHLRLGSCGRSEAHTLCQDSSNTRTVWT